MFILKFYEFNKINESFLGTNKLNGWYITYNHNDKHDLNLRILERSKIKNELDLKFILNQITNKLNQLNLHNIELVFESSKFECKFVVIVDREDIRIKTILKNSYMIRSNDKIIKI